MTKKTRFFAAVLAVMMLAGCSAAAGTETSSSGTAEQSSSSAAAETPDAVASASLYYYKDNSLTGEALRTAIDTAQGACAVATVNADGTVNLANFVPVSAGEEHLAFTFAENVTRDNLSCGDGMVTYYIYDKDASAKAEMYQGARMKIALETDQEVIDKLAAENPHIPQGVTYVKILEVLPLG